MADVNTQQSPWIERPLAERADMLRNYQAKKEKFGFQLKSPPCAYEYVMGTVRGVSPTGSRIEINGAAGIGLIEVPMELILNVFEATGDDA